MLHIYSLFIPPSLSTTDPYPFVREEEPFCTSTVMELEVLLAADAAHAGC